MTVRIRPFQLSDQHALTTLANNPRIFKNVRDLFPHPYTEVDAQIWIEFCLKQKPPFINQAIEVDGAFAGGIGIVPGKDVHRISAEIGYWLGEPYWNKGVMTTAVTLFLEEVWQNFPEVSRIWAGIFDYNQASMKVLEKAGFQLEAIHRKAIIKHNQVFDEHLYVIYRPSV